MLDGIALDVQVLYNTRLIFHRFSDSSIMEFRSSWVRFVYSVCNKLMSFKSVPCVNHSMTVLNMSATSGIVTTMISSSADTCAGCLFGGVDWISNTRQGTKFNFWSRYHSRPSPTMPGKLLCAKITHSSRVSPHQMDSGNPVTTFSVTNLQSMATATKVKVCPRPISSTTSASGILASETHLLTMNRMAQTW